MKKTLLSLFAGVLIAGSASAQCVPDPAYANATGNFFPDSAEFIDNNTAMAGIAYEAVIDIKTISDTAVANPINPSQTIDAVIDGFRVYSIEWPEGEPVGFGFIGGGPTFEIADPNTNYNANSDSTWWNNYGVQNDASTVTPVQGCLTISADAAAVAAAAPAQSDPELYIDYPVIVNVDARIVKTTPDVSFLLANGSWLSESGGLVDPLPVEGYVIRVFKSTGVTEMLNSNIFDVAQSYPNPAGNEAIISFTNPRIEEVEFNVFNMLGALVHSETVLSERGVNNIELNTGRMSSGLYVYTVSNGTKTYTKKLTVK